MLAFLGKYSCEYTINKHLALSHFGSHYIVILATNIGDFLNKNNKITIYRDFDNVRRHWSHLYGMRGVWQFRFAIMRKTGTAPLILQDRLLILAERHINRVLSVHIIVGQIMAQFVDKPQ